LSRVSARTSSRRTWSPCRRQLPRPSQSAPLGSQLEFATGRDQTARSRSRIGYPSPLPLQTASFRFARRSTTGVGLSPSTPVPAGRGANYLDLTKKIIIDMNVISALTYFNELLVPMQAELVHLAVGRLEPASRVPVRCSRSWRMPKRPMTSRWLTTEFRRLGSARSKVSFPPTGQRPILSTPKSPNWRGKSATTRS